VSDGKGCTLQYSAQEFNIAKPNRFASCPTMTADT
jgi:hypothetical protein